MSIKSQRNNIAIPDITIKNQRNPNYIMNKKEKDVPLHHGNKARSKKGFSENVETEMHEGKKQPQSVAIAYSLAHEKKNPHYGKKRYMSKERHSEHR